MSQKTWASKLETFEENTASLDQSQCSQENCSQVCCFTLNRRFLSPHNWHIYCRSMSPKPICLTQTNPEFFKMPILGCICVYSIAIFRLTRLKLIAKIIGWLNGKMDRADYIRFHESFGKWVGKITFLTPEKESANPCTVINFVPQTLFPMVLRLPLFDHCSSSIKKTDLPEVQMQPLSGSETTSIMSMDNKTPSLPQSLVDGNSQQHSRYKNFWKPL